MEEVENEISRTDPPPTVAYGTFINFLNRMRKGVPQRVDRSVMQSLSGGSQGKLIAALGYFDLIDGRGNPREFLSELIRADGTERQRLLQQVVHRWYSFVLGGNFDLARGTRQELEKLFGAQGIGGRKLQQAIAFFLSMAQDAGLKVSTHISSAQDRARNLRPRNDGIETDDPLGKRFSRQPRGECLALVVSKLADLDANWSEQLKIRWLESFDGVVALLKSGSRESLFSRAHRDAAASTSSSTSNSFGRKHTPLK